MVAFLLYLTFTAEHQVDTVADEERPSRRIDVVGSKWEWTFDYPAYGITQRSGTVGRQPLVVPAGEPIRFQLILARRDPLVLDPGASLQARRDPGRGPDRRRSTVHAAGVFPGQCAEFCGLRHADMMFTVDAIIPRRSRAWARSERDGTVSNERRHRAFRRGSRA